MKLRTAICVACACLLLPGAWPASAQLTLPPFDRHALVVRHNPVLRQFDAANPFSVGNGNFAFTADVTGLQTFAEAYSSTTPLAACRT